MKVHPLDGVAYTQLGRMADAGATVARPGVVEAKFAGRCMRPQARTMQYRTRGPGPDESVWVDTELRCRRCEACRQYAQKVWMARAIVEGKLASRSWFGTLTLNPGTRMRHLNTLREAMARYGEDYDSYPSDYRWRNAVRMLGRDVTLWLDRVRKQSGAAFRYLLCTEPHRDGTPHVHILLHEGEGGVQIGRRTLEGQWARNGFSKWKLTDGDPVRAAAYVTKYITKTMDARVRASIGYGDAEEAIAAYRSAAVRSASPTGTPPVAKGHPPTMTPQRGGEASPDRAQRDVQAYGDFTEVPHE